MAEEDAGSLRERLEERVRRRLAANGSVHLPRSFRTALGAQAGDVVALELRIEPGGRKVVVVTVDKRGVA